MFPGITSALSLQRLLWSGVTSIGEDAFRGCSSLTEVTLPDGVTAIGDAAFYGCAKLLRIALPDGLLTIGTDAFSDCSSLTEMTIPDTVTFLSKYVFYNCSDLTSVTLSGSMTKVEHDTFYGCSSLTQVTIPKGIASLGERAFYGCTSLTDVYYGDSKTAWEAVDIGAGNDCLLNANIHFTESDTPSGPVTDIFVWPTEQPDNAENVQTVRAALLKATPVRWQRQLKCKPESLAKLQELEAAYCKAGNYQVKVQVTPAACSKA